ncbi:aspartyl-phosphate phosphatase Spo0E family protein [Pelosinus propionicus]|uniref:Spo0E like sporulation regulatory protein n=1 Tax=Pelosinus propionicus DSM 13327 TaxID=1123291 RepID=A0A1I4QKS5_9FIRM|nr:aspartyl-phosphate phosphatase Spo0E family protein [Pelosinus propionicus]SFM40285.1 Spo0E like sporulation regulatory protein [Pelosinus propionicus DSM 13327]
MIDLEIKKLWEEIEQLRDKLHDVASKKGIKSPQAIRASHMLDIKMNEYYRLKK